jgi:N-acetyl-beta-hexosaminidase
MLPLISFLALPAHSGDKLKLVPKPQEVKWLKGEGAAGKAVVLTPDKLAGSPGQELYDAFKKKLPKQGLGTEGYMLEVNAERMVIIVAHKYGYLHALETLKQLRDPEGNYKYCRIADWPHGAMRGVMIQMPPPGKQPLVLRFIKEVLVPLKCNAIVMQIGFMMEFTSFPKLSAGRPWSKEQIREVAALCRENGISLIPLFNCLGHQNWKQGPPARLLRVHPEFEEIPDAKTPETNPKSKSFYCRSWCPLHPEVNTVVFSLMDELIEATQCKYFHVGLDEVFVIGSDKCPRCKGKDPAELFAKAVNDYYGHLTKKRGVRMMMWGDRLLSSASTGYGDYEAAANGTDDAIKMIPKDIIITDWHYTNREEYPSLYNFRRKGFYVWPSVWHGGRSAEAFMTYANREKGDKMLGVLVTNWASVEGYAYKALKIKPPKGFKPAPNTNAWVGTMRASLSRSWNPD